MSVKNLIELDMEGARKALAVAGYIRDWKQGSDDEIKSILFDVLGCYGIKDANTNFVEQRIYDEELEARKDAELKAYKLEKKLNKYKKAVDEITDTGAYEQEVNGRTEFLRGIDYCLKVIDKCKEESKA